MLKSREYTNLLTAEKTLVQALGEVEPNQKATVAQALVRVIEQKRIMRGQPAPKPADSVRKSRRTAATPTAAMTYPEHVPSALTMHDASSPSSSPGPGAAP